MWRPPTPDPEAARIGEFLAGAFGPSALAIVHYGSQIRPADAHPESAHDFFVILERYTDGYRSLAAKVGTRYSPRTAALLNHILPPNVISIAVPGPEGPRTAKCAVFELPLRDDEKFGPHGVGDLCNFLAQSGLLHNSGGAWHWTSDTYPADSISPRARAKLSSYWRARPDCRPRRKSWPIQP